MVYVNPVRFGLIGTGAIVEQFLAAGAEHPDFAPHALLSRDAARGGEFAARYGIDRVYTSLDAFLADPGIEAVYIASPNALHAPMAIAALQAGKHVLCEKPLALGQAQARAMVAAAREAGCILMEAMRTLCLPGFQAARDALPSLGPIRRYSAAYCQYSSRYRRFQVGDVAAVFDPSLGGGALRDLGVYTLAPLVALFGLPDAVQASAGILSNGVDGQGTAILQYPGMEAVVQYSKISHGQSPLEIQGEDATLVVDHAASFERVCILDHDGQERDISRPRTGNGLWHELDAFLACLRSLAPPPVSNALSVDLAGLVETIHAAAVAQPLSWRRES